MAEPKGLPEQIRAAREKAGLTQAELGRRVDLAPSHIARLESGEKSSPRFETVARIAAELGLSLDGLSTASGFRGAEDGAAAAVQAANELRALIASLERVRRSAESAIAKLEAAAKIKRPPHRR